MANQVVEIIQFVLRKSAPYNTNHQANKKHTQCKPVDEKSFLEGTVDNSGTTACVLSDERGGVYGFAIELTKKQKKKFFEDIVKAGFKRRILNLDDWKPIAENYYPLYWGKDVNLGFRLYEHTKANKTCASIALCRPEFAGYKIIYGAVLCKNRDVYESILHCDYSDLLKNHR